MSATNVSESGLRLLSLAELLCGYAARGATNGDLAEALKTSRPNVTRDMAVLIVKGWARKSEDTGRFYPTTAFTRMLFRATDDVSRMQTQVDDLRRSMTGR
jgi:DNA-binding IclR family transcriptional regulator